MQQTRSWANILGIVGLLVVALPERAAASLGASVTDRAVSGLCDKRIAVLAELPSHGEGRAFSLKADIVKALVARCGFDAVLFEAPIYDFIGMENSWGKASATPMQLDNAIGRFWWARQLADFRRWLFDEANHNRLKVGGLDDQISITSEYAQATLAALVAASVPADESQACRASVERNLRWAYDESQAWDDAEKALLLGCARSAARTPGQAPTRLDAGARAMMSANFASYVERQTGSRGAADRDLAMYRNALWHLERLPSGSKVIVWTATVHGAKRQGNIAVEPLGQRLYDDWGSRLGTVGFTAFSGRSSMAGMPPKSLPVASEESLEGRASSTGTSAAYVDASALREYGEIESRLLGKFSVADWSTLFDGVVVVREETPAEFEKLH